MLPGWRSLKTDSNLAASHATQGLFQQGGRGDERLCVLGLNSPCSLLFYLIPADNLAMEGVLGNRLHQGTAN